ncbi:hypothetical protein N7456_003078 [Penicillium angulare]|uniref:Uncharacterized protein n=1 Tax=Penicillium angulare TaxID=116970 RepID=A0A9W9FU33_9EURO|nr:hypothetical protein N7456_003078 [Penicillium angulare]
MPLLSLPTELIYLIAECLPTQGSIKALIATHPRFANLSLLYKFLYDKTPKSRLTKSLAWAATNGHEELASAMLRLGAKAVYQTWYSYLAPLAIAVERGHMGITKLLLEHDLEVICHPTRYNKALTAAVRGGRIELLELLLNFSDVSHMDSSYQGQSFWAEPVRQALSIGNQEMVSLLLADTRFQLDTFSLGKAAQGGNENLVKLCLEKAPRPCFPSPEQVLCWAAYEGQPAAVKALLEDGGFDPNGTDQYGQTPLHHAAKNPNAVGVIRLLLAIHNIQADLANPHGMTPLHCAASFGNLEAVRLLLASRQVNLESQDDFFRTPLSFAAMHGMSEVVKLLLATGCVNPDSMDVNAQTPLSLAAGCGDVDTVRLLLAVDAVDPDSRDKRGRTPLSWAKEQGRAEVVRILLDSGRVNPDTEDTRSV